MSAFDKAGYWDLGESQVHPSILPALMASSVVQCNIPQRGGTPCPGLRDASSFLQGGMRFSGKHNSIWALHLHQGAVWESTSDSLIETTRTWCEESACTSITHQERGEWIPGTKRGLCLNHLCVPRSGLRSTEIDLDLPPGTPGTMENSTQTVWIKNSCI